MVQPGLKMRRLQSFLLQIWNIQPRTNSIIKPTQPSLIRSSSSSSRNTSQWQLLSAVCLERKPILTQPPTEIEARFAKLLEEIEYENSLKSDHEMRLEEDLLRAEKLKRGQTLNPELDTTIMETAQDMEDSATVELERFHFLPRITEADLKNDQTSLQRALDKYLILVVKQKLGSNSRWVLPQGPWTEGETMRQTAERVMKTYCGDKLKARFLGNSPCGYYKYKYPRQMWGEGKPIGAKVFFFKAHYVMGEIEPFMEEIEDFKWLKHDEMREILLPSYFDAVSNFLVHSSENFPTEKAKKSVLSRIEN